MASRSDSSPPSLSRCRSAPHRCRGVISGADAVVVSAGHREYRGLVPLCGSAHPAVVDGRNVVDPHAGIAADRGDEHGHTIP